MKPKWNLPVFIIGIYHSGAKIFQKSMSHLRIPEARRVA
jgi:hypothetical protein